MTYIDYMKQTAARSYDSIYGDVDKLVFTDFPDYPNVGDSAIALGQLKYFSENSIKVEAAYCIATLPRSVYDSKTAVMINGGGNIAGLFEGIDDHRNRIAQNLRPETLLIQAPQSIHFATKIGRERFIREFASRDMLRMAVRDQTAVRELRGIIDDPLLAPDAVHHLGKIASPPPTQRTTVLARRDQESGASDVPPGARDWKKDTRGLAFTSFIRWKAIHSPLAARLLNKPASAWENIANQRLHRGVQILSEGETVVTDRLHAMLIALQMGRSVIAVDNNNRKLTKYSDTWFGEAQPDIRFANSFTEAMRIAE